MDEKIEPCWFCGSINISVESLHKEYRLSHWWIECCDCGARGSKRDSKEAAKTSWTIAKVYAERDAATTRADKAEAESAQLRRDYSILHYRLSEILSIINNLSSGLDSWVERAHEALKRPGSKTQQDKS